MRCEDDIPDTFEDSGPGFVIDPDGHVRNRTVWNEDPAQIDAVEQGLSIIEDDWRIDRGQQSRLRRHLTELAQSGRHVFVVVPPLSNDFPPLMADDGAGYDEYLEAARELSGDGVTVIDRSGDDFGDELFADTHHLNELGAERLTAVVGSDILADQEGRPLPLRAHRSPRTTASRPPKMAGMDDVFRRAPA